MSILNSKLPSVFVLFIWLIIFALVQITVYTYNHNIPMKTPPSSVKSVFSSTFRKELDDLMLCRRDVRNFRKDPIDQKILEKCLGSFLTAPSVGLSEPWRIVNVSSIDVRSKAIENFERCNKEALQEYNDWRARKYAKLKLSGMQDAPVHLAIYCDEGTHKGYNLGSKTMPEMLRYSVVSAITLLWLSLRSYGLGMGWVSILDEKQLAIDLDIPKTWKLIGYFCIGWPERYSLDPELEEKKWERRRGSIPFIQR